MRLVPGRASGALAAAGCFGLALSALAQQASPPAPTIKAPVPLRASAAAEARLAEIKAELAWLADPATFPCQLAARHVGAALEVGGFVPSDALRQKAVELARSHCQLKVVDKVVVHPNSMLPVMTTGHEHLSKSAAESLGRAMKDHGEVFEFSTDNRGQITVSGKIASWEDKLNVSRRLSQLPGCNSVVNNFTVQNVLRDGQTCHLVSADGKFRVPAPAAAALEGPALPPAVAKVETIKPATADPIKPIMLPAPSVATIDRPGLPAGVTRHETIKPSTLPAVSSPMAKLDSTKPITVPPVDLNLVPVPPKSGPTMLPPSAPAVLPPGVAELPATLPASNPIQQVSATSRPAVQAPKRGPAAPAATTAVQVTPVQPASRNMSPYAPRQLPPSVEASARPMQVVAPVASRGGVQPASYQTPARRSPYAQASRVEPAVVRPAAGEISSKPSAPRTLPQSMAAVSVPAKPAIPAVMSAEDHAYLVRRIKEMGSGQITDVRFVPQERPEGTCYVLHVKVRPGANSEALGRMIVQLPELSRYKIVAPGQQ